MELLADLDAFFLEHHRCGDLDTGLLEGPVGGQRVWMTCSCGAYLNRELGPADEARR